MINVNRREEGIAFLNQCFENGISWRSALMYATQKFHCTQSCVAKWREYTKYYEPK